MNTFEKAKILGPAGKYDSCGPKTCEVNVREGLGGIYYAKAEHKTCRIFKTLMDNNCSYDCKYCSNRNHSCKKKASYKPEELSSLFMHLHKNLAVEGLFLSSGVSGDADKTTEKMIDAVKLLRYKHKFRGYVHFKILPGTSHSLVKYASKFANRMSINIEAPNKEVMHELSSCKEYKTDILRRQMWISKLGKNQTTQVILSRLATDKDILKMSDWEYENTNLRRMYFAAFRPVEGTPMEKEKAEPLHRQNRLYNADFLVRCYNYKFKEFNSIMDKGMLPRTDPKLALAKANFEGAIDINQASYEELIRIPGIGPKTAENIMHHKGLIKKYEHLHKMGAQISKAKPFIEVDGHRQKMLIEF